MIPGADPGLIHLLQLKSQEINTGADAALDFDTGLLNRAAVRLLTDEISFLHMASAHRRWFAQFGQTVMTNRSVAL
jgi:hypothetical protein